MLLLLSGILFLLLFALLLLILFSTLFSRLIFFLHSLPSPSVDSLIIGLAPFLTLSRIFVLATTAGCAVVACPLMRGRLRHRLDVKLLLLLLLRPSRSRPKLCFYPIRIPKARCRSTCFIQH